MSVLLSLTKISYRPARGKVERPIITKQNKIISSIHGIFKKEDCLLMSFIRLLLSYNLSVEYVVGMIYLINFYNRQILIYSIFSSVSYQNDLKEHVKVFSL